MPAVGELIGQRFSRLLVVGETSERLDGRIVWLCLCDCGGTTTTIRKRLRNGDKKSCGCLRREHLKRFGDRYIDLAGQRFGRLVAIKATIKDSNNSFWWQCKCDCGNTKDIRGQHLRGGNIKSCGCYNISVHMTYHDPVLGPDDIPFDMARAAMIRQKIKRKLKELKSRRLGI